MREEDRVRLQVLEAKCKRLEDTVRRLELILGSCAARVHEVLDRLTADEVIARSAVVRKISRRW